MTSQQRHAVLDLAFEGATETGKEDLAHFLVRRVDAEKTAEADRGRHPGFRASTSLQAAPAA
jgi:hypothetical protein